MKIKRNRRLTAPEIAADVNVGRSKPVSVTTVKRRLLDGGLKGCIVLSKLLVRAINKKKKRLNWLRPHQN